MEEDEFIKGHEDAINNALFADYFKSYPEKVKAMTEKEKENLNEKLKILNDRFYSLIPYITSTKTYIKSITEKTKFSACFLLFHKTIETWQAIILLSEKGFYYEVMELSRSTSENMDLAKTFILDDKDNKLITKWFTGKIIGHGESRSSLENVFNSGGFLSKKIPLSKTMNNIYSTMSTYTHGGYGAMLELVNVFTKDFDFDKSAGFHRLDEQTDVLKNLVNNIHYSLIFFYTSLVKDKNKSEELIKLVPVEFSEKMSEEDIKKHYEKYNTVS